MPAISIITCTRNPHPDHLRRVLVGIEALVVPEGWGRELVLVDSASDHPLAERAEERLFLSRNPWARIVRTEEPGLSVARRRGLQESRGELLVWLDDDNVAEPDYLAEVVRAATAHPTLTVWGAGRITVEFTGPVPRWVERTMRPAFQERRHAHDEMGRSAEWAPYFPVGSGLVTRRAAVERWSEAIARGRYTLTGRRGRALSAGDDAQVIFGAVAAGEEVGVIAAQRLTHLIAPSRCTARYLARMEFGISASLQVARAECLGAAAPAGAAQGVTRVLGATLATLRRHGLVDGPRQARLELARRLGALAGSLEAARRPEPRWLRTAIGAFGLR